MIEPTMVEEMTKDIDCVSTDSTLFSISMENGKIKRKCFAEEGIVGKHK